MDSYFDLLELVDEMRTNTRNVRPKLPIRVKTIEKDYISKMTDDVLGLILSHLDAKDGVSTSILSQRWKSVWKFMTKLQFVNDNETPLPMFINFVDHVVKDAQSNLEEFHFQLNRFPIAIEASKLDEIMINLAQKKVQKIYLDVEVALPRNLLSSNSLVSLTLEGGTPNLEIPDNLPCFPSLKFLSILLDEKEFPSKLLSRCLVLEELIVYGLVGRKDGEDDMRFYVNVPTLKILRLNLASPDVHTCEIKSPNIGCLSVSSCHLSEIVIDVSPLFENVVIACQSCESLGYDVSVDRRIGFVKAITKAKRLMLCHCVINNVLPVVFGTLPMLTSLKHLSLKLDIWGAGGPPLKLVYCVLKLLEVTPNLEVLELYVCDDGHPISTAQAEEDNRLLNPPDSIPTCVSSSIKEVRVVNMERHSGILVRYLLENCLILEKFKIEMCKAFRERRCLMEAVPDVKIASPVCKIVVLSFGLETETWWKGEDCNGNPIVLPMYCKSMMYNVNVADEINEIVQEIWCSQIEEIGK